MRIKVKIFATLVKKIAERLGSDCPSPLRSGELFEVELPEESTLADLLRHLKLDRKEAVILFVNARAQKHDYCLVSGDQVGLFPPVGGG